MRDSAMVDMVKHTLAYQDKKAGKQGVSKAVVWAHSCK
jgi:hypothetical protein